MVDKDFSVQLTSSQDWARNDETSKGLTCPECGALLPAVGGPVKRHREFHERLDEVLARIPSASADEEQ